MQDKSPGGEPIRLTDSAFEILCRYRWPGNIRQLRFVLRTAVALCSGGVLRADDLPQGILTGSEQAADVSRPASACVQEGASPLEVAERETLLSELERHRWNVTRTASALHVSRNTLYRKMRHHSIRPS